MFSLLLSLQNSNISNCKYYLCTIVVSHFVTLFAVYSRAVVPSVLEQLLHILMLLSIRSHVTFCGFCLWICQSCSVPLEVWLFSLFLNMLPVIRHDYGSLSVICPVEPTVCLRQPCKCSIQRTNLYAAINKVPPPLGVTGQVEMKGSDLLTSPSSFLLKSFYHVNRTGTHTHKTRQEEEDQEKWRVCVFQLWFILYSCRLRLREIVSKNTPSVIKHLSC